MLFSGILDAGLVLFLGAIFAHYLGYTKKSKGWPWIVVAAVFLIFSGIPIDWSAYYGLDISVVPIIFETVGWIVALVGALYTAYEIFLSK